MNDPYRFRPLEKSTPSMARIMDLLDARLESAFPKTKGWDCSCYVHRDDVRSHLHANASNAEDAATKLYEFVRKLEGEGWKRGYG